MLNPAGERMKQTTKENDMEEGICRGPRDYDPARDGVDTFSFTDPVSYPCFADGTLWNGFDNVAVSVPTRDLIVADWAAMDGTDEATLADLRTITPDSLGRIPLGFCYATQLDRPALPVTPAANRA